MYLLGINWIYGNISVSYGGGCLFAQIFMSSKELLYEQFI